MRSENVFDVSSNLTAL